MKKTFWKYCTGFKKLEMNFYAKLCIFVTTALVTDTSFLASDLNSRKYSTIFFENSVNFIKNLVQQKMQNCDLVFAHDNNPLYKSEIEDTLTTLAFLKTLGGSFIIPIRENITVLSEFNDNHQKSIGNGCSVVVIMIHQLKSGIYEQLFDILTPRYGPITRKDEDYFFFFGAYETVDKLLLSPEFGNKIKYKIALVEDLNHKGKIIYKTVHFYKNFGNPVLIELDLNAGGKNEITNLKAIFPDRTGNHYGRAMKMSCPIVPFRIEITLRDGRYHPKRGYYKYWLDAAMKKWNFTYDIFFSSFGRGTGAMLANGTWTGGLGDVLYERAELAYVIGHIYSRHKFVEWSAPLSYEWMIFVCHKPRTFFSAQAIFWPFSTLMWSLFLLTIAINVVLVKLLLRAQGGRELSDQWKLQKIFIYIYASLLEQDAKDPSKMPFNPIRIFCTFWLLFAVIVACAYRAKLVSVIAFPVSSFVPDTFEELADSNFHSGLNTIGKGDAAYIRFSTTPSPVFKKMFQKMDINPNGLACLRKAVQEDICYIIWKGIAEYEDMKNISDKHGRSPLQLSSSTTYFIHDGMVWHKRAIFREHFDRSIWNAVSMGLTDQWVKMDWDFVRRSRNKWEKAEKIPERNYGEDNGPQKLQVVHFTGALAILFCGIFIGALLFVFYELLPYKLSHASVKPFKLKSFFVKKPLIPE